ncbi:MAG: S8 family serine peptidase [Oscillospiraceae bacterium]|nr:S8 family serine peptidase [Oscillospiraceae bacterium]
MKATVRKYRRYICLVLCLIISIGSTANAFDQERREDISQMEFEEKIYSNATIDQDFDGSSVLVIMDKSVGGINKQHRSNFFSNGKIEIKEVVDLTVITPHEVKVAESRNRVRELERVRESDHRDGIDYDDLNEEMLEVDPEVFRQILKIELPVDSKENVLAVIKELEKIEGVKYAGPNYYEYPNNTIINPPSNDPALPFQWNYFSSARMHIRSAWNITIGSRAVRVGVIDSGIANHPDLNANLVTGWDFVNNNSITNDDPTGHGTFVAGVIGAVGNNGMGIAGVCWNVSLIPLQIINSNGRFSADDQIAAITWAINNNVPIINYSGVGTAVNAARNQAIAAYPGLFICAAGNNGHNNDITPYYPSDLSRTLTNVISVGATNHDDIRATGWSDEKSSNWGASSVSLFAPGDLICSTFLGNSYTVDSGTSFAAPMVTGVAALIKSIRPDFTPQQIKDCILYGVDQVAGLSGLCVTGGRLNAYKALQRATEPDTFMADVNGDGRADMILSRNNGGKRAFTVYLGQSNGTFGEPITSTSTRNFIYGDPVFVGDVTGNGRADMIVHWSSGGKRQLLVYRGNTNGTFSEGVNFASDRNHDPVAYPCKFFVGRVNNDNRDDFIVHWRQSNGKRAILVYLGTTSGLFQEGIYALQSNNDYIANDPVFVADMNGDGRVENIVHWSSGGKRQLLTYTANANGTYNVGGNLNSARNHDQIAYPCQFFVGRVNSDNMADFVVHWRQSNGKRANLVYGGASNGIFTEAIYAIQSTNDYIASDPVFMGDVTGNGRNDMIVHWSSGGKRQLLVYRANTDGSYSTGVNTSSARNHNPYIWPAKFFVGRVNNDNRDDFVVKWNNSGNIAFLTYTANSNGTFNEALYTVPNTAVPYFTH